MATAKAINEVPDERSLLAYCGLYCGDCYRHRGNLADLSRDLRKELRKEKFSFIAERLSKYPFFRVFKNYKQCYEVLGVIVKLRCKRGCRGGDGPPVCKIRECCKKKSVTGCWECGDFETCKTIEFLKPFHEDAYLKNLKLLQKSGVDSFINGKRYW